MGGRCIFWWFSKKASSSSTIGPEQNHTNHLITLPLKGFALLLWSGINNSWARQIPHEFHMSIWGWRNVENSGANKSQNSGATCSTVFGFIFCQETNTSLGIFSLGNRQILSSKKCPSKICVQLAFILQMTSSKVQRFPVVPTWNDNLFFFVASGGGTPFLHIWPWRRAMPNLELATGLVELWSHFQLISQISWEF